MISVIIFGSHLCASFMIVSGLSDFLAQSQSASELGSRLRVRGRLLSAVSISVADCEICIFRLVFSCLLT